MRILSLSYRRITEKSPTSSFVLFYAFRYLSKATPVFISKLPKIRWINLTEPKIFSFKICFCKILYMNSPDRRLRGLTDDGFLIQFNLCFINKYISNRSNRKWLLIMWAMSTYLQMVFQIYYYCTRVTYINYNKNFCMTSPEAVVQRCSEKKLLLKLLAEFTGKHLCWSLFNNVSCLQTCNFIKRDSNTGVFLWILWNF